MSDAEDRERVLGPLRRQIDAIDDRLVALVAERMHCVEQVVLIKQQHGLPARLENRVEEVVARVRAQASALGAPPDLADILWRTMIEWVIAYEDKKLNPASGESQG